MSEQRWLSPRDAGDPVELAERYNAQGADELVFLDITASSDAREISDTAPRFPRSTALPVAINRSGCPRNSDSAGAHGPSTSRSSRGREKKRVVTLGPSSTTPPRVIGVTAAASSIALKVWTADPASAPRVASARTVSVTSRDVRPTCAQPRPSRQIVLTGSAEGPQLVKWAITKWG